jgi:hypothetical protein
MNKFYTYAYLREDGTPYYIGKGSNDRIYGWHRHIPVPKDKDRILFLKQNLTEEESFKHEKYMIYVLGRKDLGTGILINLTEGGGGNSGWIPSEETKKKMSEKRKGKVCSEETKKKMSETLKGRTLSEDHKRKISESHKGKSLSEQTRKKLSESKMGEKNHLYGKPKSEETKRKISESLKRKRVLGISCSISP